MLLLPISLPCKSHSLTSRLSQQVLDLILCNTKSFFRQRKKAYKRKEKKRKENLRRNQIGGFSERERERILLRINVTFLAQFVSPTAIQAVRALYISTHTISTSIKQTFSSAKQQNTSEEETRLEYQKPSSSFLFFPGPAGSLGCRRESGVYIKLYIERDESKWVREKEVKGRNRKRGNIHWASQIESCWDEK